MPKKKKSNTESQKKKEISEAEAEKIKQEARQKRRQDCIKAFQELLQEHKCEVSVAVTVSANGNHPHIDFIPR